MLRNFFRIVVLLTFVVVVYITSVELVLFDFLEGNLSNNPDKSPYHVPFFTIKRELFSKPQSQWPEIIKELQKHYGYPLELKKFENLDLNVAQKKELKKDKILNLGGGNFFHSEEIWYSTLKDSNLIIILYESDSDSNFLYRKNKGNFYGLFKYMTEVPETEWQRQFDLFQQQYGVIIKRTPIKELKIDNKMLIKLENDNIVGINLDLPTQTVFKIIPNSHDVLQIKLLGNLDSDNFLIKNLIPVILVLLASLLILALFLWMRPIWRDLNTLNSVTTKFGQGDFQIRSTLPKKSAIWNLSETFNNMATRISKLITSHKDLTNAVSHELRTPLSRLRFANAMLNEDKDDSHKQEYIDSMRVDIEELELLVSELLSYARFDRENPELKYCELNISDWLTEVIEKIESENINTNLQIINSINNKSQLINIDPKLIERVLNNLVRNAIRYAKNRVDICLSIKDNNCCISVDDDGSGIPESERERILQPFTRLDFSRNRKTGGYGLGLSIVQQIIKWHNGSINISTSRYKGASFEICLPIKLS
ncbi:MAG: ATP-binding protein [Thiohalomonadales bacterium]